jgi:hypothetical protein
LNISAPRQRRRDHWHPRITLQIGEEPCLRR